MMIDPRDIKCEDGLNPRDFGAADNSEHVAFLKSSIRRDGVKVPLTVRLKGEGRARRIVVTLSGMADWARNQGVKALDARTYSGGIFTGEAPKPRGQRFSGRAA